MSLRSTNILVILVLLNGAAVLVGAMPVSDDLGYQPTVGGDQQIEQAQSAGQEIQSERSSLDQFVGGIIAAASTLTTMFGVVVAGPTMLINLGVPAPLVGFIAGPLYVYVGLDLLQVLSGRSITS
jgi:hypothetical protein